MKISIVEPVGGHGGMNYYDMGLCGGLMNAGVDVVLHTCDETEITENCAYIRHSYVRIFANTKAWTRGLRFLSGSLRAILSSVIEGRKIVHFHFFQGGPLELMNILLSRSFFRKVVITAHDVESFVTGHETPMLSRWVYRLAHQVISHNEVSKKELIEKLGVPKEKIKVIPHGNYLHAIGPLPSKSISKKRLGIPEPSKVLLFFGQIKDVKGLDLLLRAMPNVVKCYSNTVLVIAGRPWKSDFSRYEKMIEALDIKASCINHVEYIPDERVPDYYAAADLVVLPYRRIYQSGVLLLAMSYGKPVLVSDLSGMTEIIENGENGFVFRRGDKTSLEEQIIRALGDEARTKKLAMNGLKYVSNNHDWDYIGKETADCYKALIKS